MFNKILIGTDFSKYSRNAVSVGVALAKQFKSRLYMVHSLGRIPFIEHWTQEEIDKKIEEKAKEMKDTYCKEIEKAGIEHCVENVVYGGTVAELVKMAYSMGADLIILGPHSERKQIVEPEREVQLGSTASRVAAIAPCPVMIITRPWTY